MIRLAGTVAALLSLLVFATSAQAAPPPVNDAVQSLVTKQRSAKTRTGMGLPPYKAILGKRWKKKVTRADAKLVSKLAPAVRTAAVTDDDAKAAGDVIRTGKERQKRNLRMAVALDSLCPQFDKTIRRSRRRSRSPGGPSRSSRPSSGCAATRSPRSSRSRRTCRRGRPISDAAVLSNPTVDWGTFSVVRQQTARNLKTGKLRETGPAQRMSGSLDPFFNLETGFDSFIKRNADGDDESPAPSRPQRTNAWDQVAQSFVSMLGAAMYADLKKAEKHFRTPNVCMTLDVPAPTPPLSGPEDQPHRQLPFARPEPDAGADAQQHADHRLPGERAGPDGAFDRHLPAGAGRGLVRVHRPEEEVARQPPDRHGDHRHERGRRRDQEGLLQGPRAPAAAQVLRHDGGAGHVEHRAASTAR